MGLPQDKPASYQDIMDLPAHVVGEIIHGRLLTPAAGAKTRTRLIQKRS